VPRIAALWHQRAAARAPVLLGGCADLDESWADEDVAVTGGVFLQVNRAAAALLEEYVLSVAGAVAGQRIVDAYCGVGLHARRFARAGARVVGIELDREAVRLARRSSPEEGASPVFMEGDVGALLPGQLPADLVLLNPPRAGLDGTVIDALARMPPRRVLYVSCDAATLARDLKRLAGVFRVRSVRCFDLFPQTAHVETVVELACATS
jgi:23S rRNA (uracil1939-C5)-methyltransferase